MLQAQKQHFTTVLQVVNWYNKVDIALYFFVLSFGELRVGEDYCSLSHPYTPTCSPDNRQGRNNFLCQKWDPQLLALANPIFHKVSRYI